MAILAIQYRKLIDMALTDTEKMDGWTEEDVHTKNQVYKQCRTCGEWTFFENKNQPEKTCVHCQSSRFDPQSTTSKRTFDPARAKLRKYK